MKLNITPFGTIDGKINNKYTFTTKRGTIFSVMNYGATLVDVIMADKEGRSAQLITGFDTLSQYQESRSFFGATVGRFANRIGGAAFVIDGQEFKIAANDGENNIHGGPVGFEGVYWQAEVLEEANRKGILFTYTSADGESGFPGTLHVSASYLFSDSGEIEISYRATTDKATPINMTNHTYWNMAGVGNKVHVLDQNLTIKSHSYTPVDGAKIPTGKIEPVGGTALDFRQAKPVGHAPEQEGYDHNWVLDNGGKLTEAAIFSDTRSGRCLTVLTDQPGLQVYSAFGMSGERERSGETYSSLALALETQNYPNSINEPGFPNALLRPDDTYEKTTIFKLSLLDR